MSAPEDRDPFRCQCKRFGVACDSRATQEDLLCGICRDEGCDAAVGFDDSGPCTHVRLSLPG